MIAKADHTEQILYSDIGKLLRTLLTSWAVELQLLALVVVS